MTKPTDKDFQQPIAKMHDLHVEGQAAVGCPECCPICIIHKLVEAKAPLSNFQKVRAFHEVMSQPERATPGLVDIKTQRLRLDLIEEEAGETSRAMENLDLPEIADGLIDLLYVTYGACAVYGIDADAVFDVVHRANMAKVGGPKREDGKFLKPEGWKPPDVAGGLKRQGWEGGS